MIPRNRNNKFAFLPLIPSLSCFQVFHLPASKKSNTQEAAVCIKMPVNYFKQHSHYW